VLLSCEEDTRKQRCRFFTTAKKIQWRFKRVVGIKR